MSASPNPGVKVLATNGLIHCSGVCGMLDNMLDYGHQFVLSETATAHSILYGIHSSKVGKKRLNKGFIVFLYFLCAAGNHPDLVRSRSHSDLRVIPC